MIIDFILNYEKVIQTINEKFCNLKKNCNFINIFINFFNRNILKGTRISGQNIKYKPIILFIEVKKINY